MAAITFLRDKKWIITGFALLGIGLLFLSAIPAIYHTTSQEKDNIFIEGKYYTKEQYKQLLKNFNYNEDQLRQYLRQETLAKQILAETGTYVTNKDVEAIMYNTDNKHVQQVFKQYYRIPEDSEPKVYKKYLEEIKKSRQNITQYTDYLKNALEAEKATQFLPKHPQDTLLEKEAPKKNITYRRISLNQIITDDKKDPTPQAQEDFLRQHQHQFSTKVFTKVLYQRFPIPPSHQEIKKAEQQISNWRQEFETTDKNPKNYASSRSDNPEQIIREWDQDKIPHFLRDKKIGYVSAPQRVGNQYRMYRIKETKNSEGKFVVYQITKNITCKDNLPHIKKRVEALQQEHRTQNYHQIHKKYGYYFTQKEDPITIDIHPHMVNYPPNKKEGAIARKIFQEHYKRGQYFSIEIKDNKTNDTQEILVCTPLYRGKGNALDYNQKVIQDGIKAEQKLQQLQAAIPSYTTDIATTKDTIAQKYGSAPWVNKTITLEDTKLYNIPYPTEITNIIEDKSTPPFYAFLDKNKAHIIVVIIKDTQATTLQKVTQEAQKPEDRFKQYNTTYR